MRVISEELIEKACQYLKMEWSLSWNVSQKLGVCVGSRSWNRESSVCNNKLLCTPNRTELGDLSTCFERSEISHMNHLHRRFGVTWFVHNPEGLGEIHTMMSFHVHQLGTEADIL